VLLVLATAGCGGDGGDPPVMPTPDHATWGWMNPAAQGNALRAIWGESADNLFVAGTGGTVMRYDGSSWKRTQTPASDVLNGIWGSSANDVVAVGFDGTIVRWNGSSWSKEASGATGFLQGVWGSGPNDVFAVGQGRLILHYNGGTWTPMTVPVGGGNLENVWGSGPDNVYVTGLGPKLLHYNGATWSELTTPATFALHAIWGDGPDNIYVVGGNGAAVHWDGTLWSVINVGSPVGFNGVTGTPGGSVYAVGQSGLAYEWNGTLWTQMPTRSFKAYTAVLAIDNDVIAVGDAGTIHRLDAGEWTPMTGGLSIDLEDVWCAPNGDAFAVGDLGTIMHHRNGTWTPMETGSRENLRGVFGTAPDDVVAVGETGTVLHYNGATWSDVSTPFAIALNDVWIGPTTTFAVGDFGHVTRRDAGVWSEVPTGSFDPIYCVWGTADDNVYIGGAQSLALRWIGSQWKLVTIAPGYIHNYRDIHGTGPNDIYVGTELIVGPSASAEALHAGGYIYRWDGAEWAIVYTEPVHDLLSVWRADASHGFACGDAASLLTDSGGSWTRVWTLDNLPFYVNGLFGSSSTNVFVVGDNGTIARYGR
jgi:hypothetical protein